MGVIRQPGRHAASRYALQQEALSEHRRREDCLAQVRSARAAAAAGVAAGAGSSAEAGPGGLVRACRREAALRSIAGERRLGQQQVRLRSIFKLAETCGARLCCIMAVCAGSRAGQEAW